MIDEEKKYWVAVTQCPGIGPLRFHSLMNQLQKKQISLQELWSSPATRLEKIIPWPSIASAFVQHRQTFSAEKKWEELQTKKIEVITTKDEVYPKLLQEIPDKPAVLYVKGNLNQINSKPYAVVGTRNITPYGTFVTKKIVKELVKNSCAIISGFMYGVDAVAHQTAVEEGGYTVGVLGFGFHHMYPPNHNKLADSILAQGGALLTEYFLTQAPHPGNFPARNRIVAGLSLGVIVTEAAQKSGSKITAQFALEYGRDVFAVPGAITSQYSDGTKDLINDGAKLVTSAEDILHDMQETTPTQNLATVLEQCQNSTQKQIITTLFAQPADIDELSIALELPIGNLSSELSMMELLGNVVQHQGKYSVNF